MTALSKKLFAIVLICFALVGCGDQEKIKSLQAQLKSCQAHSSYNYIALANKKDDFEKCLTINNNLYTFVDYKGSFLDKTAKLFTQYPWQSFVGGLILLVLSIIAGYVCIGLLLELRNDSKHKEAKRTIEAAKEAQQALLDAQDKLSRAKEELAAIEAQKTTQLNEIAELSQYQNLDALRESAKIIAEAHQEAQRIKDEHMIKVNNQVSEIQAELNQEREELKTEWAKLHEDRTELTKKEQEFEEVRKSMIED